MTFTTNIPSKAELLSLVEKKVLISHAVTMASDEYIKKSTDGFLFYYLMRENNLVTVDEDVDGLKKAMLASSLDEDAVKLLMHGCVSRKHGLKIAVDKDDKKKEETEKDRLEKEADEAQVTESLRGGIELARDSMGTVRANKTTNGFNIELPVRLNTDALVFEGDSTLDEKEFLWDYLMYDAGLTMSLTIPFSIVDKCIEKINAVSSELAEDALGMARVSKLNNTTTNIIDDPWAMLGGMLNGV